VTGAAHRARFPRFHAPANTAQVVKTFRPWDFEQSWLLPPSVLDFVPPEHPAHFIRDLVRESLDLGEIYASWSCTRTRRAYFPRGRSRGLAFNASTSWR
jgi:hypothetical protein